MYPTGFQIIYKLRLVNRVKIADRFAFNDDLSSHN